MKPVTRKIPLSQGLFTIVDEDLYDYLNQWKWCAHNSRGKYYAQRNSGGKIVHMHRVILGTPKGKVTDHINGESLDNRKSNLRVCTQKDNNRNAKVRKDNSLGVPGVTLIKKNNKFKSYIHVDGKQISLGRFWLLEDAIAERKKAERVYWHV